MGAPDIIISEANTTDEGVILSLLDQLGWSQFIQQRVTKEYIHRYLAFPHNCILLARIPGEEPKVLTAGLLAYSIRPDLYHGGDACLIENFVVSREQRGRGIGSALFTYLLDRLYEANCVTLFVDVEPDNHRAIQFYRRHGFNHQVVLLERHL